MGVAYLVLPSRPILLLVGWLIRERGRGQGRGGAYLVLLAQPYIPVLVSSRFPRHVAHLVHPVVLSRRLLVVLCRPVAVVVCGVIGGAAPAVAVVVVVQVGVEGTWAGAAGASGVGGGGGGH